MDLRKVDANVQWEWRQKTFLFLIFLQNNFKQKSASKSAEQSFRAK